MNTSSTDTTVKNESTLRSLVGFDWRTNYFICSKQAIIDIRHKDRMMFKKFGSSKFVQMHLKNVTKEVMNLQILYKEDCRSTLI